MTSSEYPYRPLDLPRETRILNVETALNHDDPLICSLSHMDIVSPSEPYDALSYCWSRGNNISSSVKLDDVGTMAVHGMDEDGNKINMADKLSWREILDHPVYGQFHLAVGGVLPPGNIILDGHAITVGGELRRALRHLRSFYRPNPLRIWVDALCINQSDLAERNQHVRMMGDIYAQAENVRVWLGEETGGETAFRETMDKVEQLLYEILIKQGCLENKAPIPLVQARFLLSPQAKEFDWDAVAVFFNRAWWDRTWVIQEIAYAKKATLHVGRYSWAWEYMSGTVRMLREWKCDALLGNHRGWKGAAVMERLRSEIVEEGLPHTSWSLLTLLEELRGFKSTLASDKIYGILGLTDQKDKITVDYSKIPEQLFTDYAIQHLETGSLEILSHCVLHSDNPRLLDLPSWVPDWTRPGWVEPFRVRELAANACGEARPCFSTSADLRKLTVKGRMLDRISIIEPDQLIPSPSAQANRPLPFDKPQARDIGEDRNAQEPAKKCPENLLEFTKTAYENSPPRKSFYDNADTEQDWEDVTELEEKESKAQALDRLTRENKITSFRSILSLALGPSLPPVNPDPDSDPLIPTRKTILSNPTAFLSLARTMCCNNSRENEIPSPEQLIDGFGILYTLLRHEFGRWSSQELIEEKVMHQIIHHVLDEGDAEEVEKYRQAQTKSFLVVEGGYKRYTYHRRFFVSEQGKFGWGVEGIKEGDIVVVLYGGRYPLVLREVEGQKGKYAIVGDAYLDGFMDGEGVEEGVGEEREFVLV
ncbi:heterokaryon incompatibility protein-domain-containing protein [Cladorrhinum sp. PSN332]|nr:heterokaryon incompatibility protein-domain-containing protein [Cladorrhinum sp. PSN332]